MVCEAVIQTKSDSTQPTEPHLGVERDQRRKESGNLMKQENLSIQVPKRILYVNTNLLSFGDINVETRSASLPNRVTSLRSCPQWQGFTACQNIITIRGGCTRSSRVRQPIKMAFFSAATPCSRAGDADVPAGGRREGRGKLDDDSLTL